MFFIIDIMPGLKVLKLLVGTCRSCHHNGDLELIKTYQCLRLFFIPVFKWHTRYFLRHSCGAMMAVSEEDAIAMLHAGIMPDQVQVEVMEKGPVRCATCGRILEEDFICCPYCGNNRK
ncbi:zinc ribbon domain-containing protein [Niameybacter massiliensis]|uniref:zinc ribbon domain-containing protein n=1 Tax=Niameybacter massiliensis TaxID=1658108 RepID=UPI0006B4E663|nr:zinc ribbon domain-containing protein [Niameybacter massiliensis]